MMIVLQIEPCETKFTCEFGDEVKKCCSVMKINYLKGFMCMCKFIQFANPASYASQKKELCKVPKVCDQPGDLCHAVRLCHEVIVYISAMFSTFI